MKLFSLALACVLSLSAADLRLGIIGLDTSHVIAFTKTLNDPANPDHIAGAKVVVAFKGGSQDIETSRTRVDGYTNELQTKWNVEIVPTISAMCGKVDGIFLESNDGRKHLPQVKEAFACGKPVFIDKPLSASFEDALEIARLGKKHNVKWFSSSSLRWGDIAVQMKSPAAKSVMTWGPGPEEEHHYLELGWYAIHPIEVLFALMGPGCVEVNRTVSESGDVLVGKWKDGRIGIVRTGKPYSDYGAIVFGPKKAEQSNPKMKAGYTPMLREIIKFFEGGPTPVPNEETLEIYAFMDAAQKSKEQGGRPVKLPAH